MFDFIKKGESKKKGKSKEKSGTENFENKEKFHALESLKAEGEINPQHLRKRESLLGAKLIITRVPAKGLKEAEPEVWEEENELRNPNKKMIMPGFLKERELREKIQVNVVKYDAQAENSEDHYLDLIPNVGKKEGKLEFVFSSPKITPLVAGKRKPEMIEEYQSFMLPSAVKTEFSPMLTVKTFLELMRNKDIESIRFLLPKEDPKGFVQNLIKSSQEIDEYERSIFHIAVLEQQHEVIRLFRELGISINQYDSNNQTPLHYVTHYLSQAKVPHEELILELLRFDNAHALLAEKDDYRMTPIDYASLHKDQVFFKALEKFSFSDETNSASDVSFSCKSR